ncbi:GNAT family N-acetyltransferase [Cytophaga hutchinsonii]|uniref:N-acetyltransferase domain-containing protein n=1 Tax=Cytophaga hutchinsonii (strain ATCC 33406 / DSM 1761 / CIP 103989 / NBRC 15051 / NCIMB 9469 / D465) TaxID=269798 RepID=A0A6N4SQ35_CYTH3|nr:GNAT family N-acetyltransferase [Cytophaga hutchinsonii]ABG58457.1 conserved hypothetical protein; possible acetyltransferase [Cytophaga hutchinsonii ATCC 33406]SFX74859.1 Acetyltransferase (GNAT) domain-containing protein [Cytophaga hutchinsonii ATCC 33406]
MIEATYSDRKAAIEILTQSFNSNKSVEYVIRGGKNRSAQIKALMEYAFDMCMLFGNVYLSDDKKACGLVLLPHKKKVTLKSIELDISFLLLCSGIKKVSKILKREEAIKNAHAENSYAHLWFLGVAPKEQGKGYGSTLLNEITELYTKIGLPVYLETSTLSNLPWYKKNGFEIIQELRLGYSLFILKKEINIHHALAWN